jgi:hypothetical protein
MKTKLLLFILLPLISITGLKAQDYAASIKVSTLGVSIEGYRSITSQFNVRLGVSAFSYTANDVSSSDTYTANADLKLTSVSALADWFPFESSFRISAGLVVNLNKADITLIPKKTYTQGKIKYTPDKLGQLNAELTFNKVAPYIGIGLGNPTAGAPGLGFTFDVGTFFQGGPKASMTATKLLTPSASQSGILEDDLKALKFYPVLSFGLYYKF